MGRAFAAALQVATLAAWFLPLPALAQAEEPQWGLQASATAAAPVAQGEGRGLRLSLEPQLKWHAADADWHVRPRLRWLDQGGEQHLHADVRDFTATWRSEHSSLALGAQQVNWGRMDIVRVADVVNPVDTHDLFVEELPQAKLASWMANWEWADGPRSLQLLFVPRPGIDRLPARWQGVPVRAAQPKARWAHATWAVRHGFEAAGWSGDLIAVRGWQTSPALVPVLQDGALALQAAPARQNSLAFSADRPLGTAVLRIEALHARLRPVTALQSAPPTPRRQNSLGAGLDLRQGAWFFAGQVVAQHEAGPGMVSTRTALLSATVQRKWLQDRLGARALYIRDTGSRSDWASLQLSFEQSPHLVLQLQADRFSGETAQAFGALRHRSRVAASLRMQY